MCCTRFQITFLSLSLSLSPSLSLILSHSLSHAVTFPLSRTSLYVHAHTHTLSLALIYLQTHTHAHSLLFSRNTFLREPEKKRKVLFFLQWRKNSLFGDFSETSFEDANQDFSSTDGATSDWVKGTIVLGLRGPKSLP